MYKIDINVISYEWTIIICVSSREVRVEFLCLQFNCLYFEIMHN